MAATARRDALDAQRPTECATPSPPRRTRRRRTAPRTTLPACRAAAADRRWPAPGKRALGGARGSVRGFPSWPSSLEQIQVVRHHGPADAEQENDDGQAERRLRHGDADREDRED